MRMIFSYFPTDWYNNACTLWKIHGPVTFYADDIPCSRVIDETYWRDIALRLTHWGPKPNGRSFADDSIKWIFLNENTWISLKVSLKFVPRGPINNIPTLVWITAERCPGDKPMMVSLPTHICVIRPRWVNGSSICCDLTSVDSQ